MSRPSQRDKIICEGLKVIHERGFAGASVRDIVAAAGVSQGSFTNHFESKEAFGLEVLNLYYERSKEQTRKTLRNDSVSPVARFKAWIDSTVDSFNQCSDWNGCLIGRLGAESTSETCSIQRRVHEIFLERESDIAYCLQAAVDAGEMPSSTDATDVAAFIHAALQGSVLQARAEQTREPLERFRRIVETKIIPVA